MHWDKTRSITGNINNSGWGLIHANFLFNTIFLFPTYYGSHLSHFTNVKKKKLHEHTQITRNEVKKLIF